MDAQYIPHFQHDQVLRLIEQYEGTDPDEISLRRKPILGIPAALIAEQVACRRRARTKLPTFSLSPFIYERQALEQCSCEATARYKSSLMSGERLADLTGGLGIDLFHLAGSFTSVLYGETSRMLCHLFTANAALRGLEGVDVRTVDALSHLESAAPGHYDWIYVDPSRRADGKRAVGLGRCEPDVRGLHELLASKGGQACLKASPMLEPRQARRDLPGLRQVHVVSVDGECKEQLLFLAREPATTPCIIRAITLSSTGEVRAALERTLDSADEARPVTDVAEWFYDPDPAVAKARLTIVAAERFGLSFVSASTDYLTSSARAPEFPGRTFAVAAVIPWNRNRVRAYLRERGIDKANLARRDFPMAPERIRPMLSVGDGGEDYLFFTRDRHGSKICVHCRREPSREGRREP